MPRRAAIPRPYAPRSRQLPDRLWRWRRRSRAPAVERTSIGLSPAPRQCGCARLEPDRRRRAPLRPMQSVRCAIGHRGAAIRPEAGEPVSSSRAPPSRLARAQCAARGRPRGSRRRSDPVHAFLRPRRWSPASVPARLSPRRLPSTPATPPLPRWLRQRANTRSISCFSGNACVFQETHGGLLPDLEHRNQIELVQLSPDQHAGNERRGNDSKKGPSDSGPRDVEGEPVNLAVDRPNDRGRKTVPEEAADRQRGEGQNCHLAEQNQRDLRPRETKYAQTCQLATPARQWKARGG